MARVVMVNNDFHPFFAKPSDRNLNRPTNVDIAQGTLVNAGDLQTTQLNEASLDFSERKLYHHTETIGKP
jgi:hypothetical protein